MGYHHCKACQFDESRIPGICHIVNAQMHRTQIVAVSLIGWYFFMTRPIKRTSTGKGNGYTSPIRKCILSFVLVNNYCFRIFRLSLQSDLPYNPSNSIQHHNTNSDTNNDANNDANNEANNNWSTRNLSWQPSSDKLSAWSSKFDLGCSSHRCCSCCCSCSVRRNPVTKSASS